MPPKPKVKGRNRKRAAPTPQPSKNNKRDPQAQVFIEEESLTDEEASFQGQGNLKHQMSRMIGLLSVLLDRVEAAETQKSPREPRPAVSPSTIGPLLGQGLGASQPRQVTTMCQKLSGGRWP